MQSILNQDGTDALQQHAGRPPAKAQATSNALAGPPASFVFAPGGLTPQQLGAMNQLHETFARQVTQRISASLRTPFEVALVSVDQLSFTEFLQQMPERSYLASIDVQPLEVMVLLELDLPAAWPIIDLLMGGDGKVQPPARDLSEIEDLILRKFIHVILQELEDAWKNLLETKLGLGGRQSQQEVVRMLPPDENVLAISLEVHILEIRGTLMFCLPASVSSALLRKLAHQSVSRKRPAPAENLAARRRLVEACRFAVEMKLPELSLDVQQLLDLRPGRTLILAHRVEDPVLITVAGREVYTAYPARVGSIRAGIVESRLPSTVESEKEIL